MTEGGKSYTTVEEPILKYIKRHLIGFFIGVIMGWTTFGIGVYTTWYQEAIFAFAMFLVHNWWVTPFFLGTIAIVRYVKGKMKKTKGRENA